MFSAPALAVLGLAATLGNAHMLLGVPTPYESQNALNGPLQATGSDFPCKSTGPDTYKSSASTKMALGSTQPISFIGGATHGGGSCQVSLTYDKAPTKDSKFRVIHSIEGGCPVAGLPDTNFSGNPKDHPPGNYTFPIPSDIPTGDAVLAWTWFNRLGNREMYMNCAPVTIEGGAGKRDDGELVQRDTAAFDALPEIFKANLGTIFDNVFVVAANDLKFPNPGKSVESRGTGTPHLPIKCPGSSIDQDFSACTPVAAGASSGDASSNSTSPSAPSLPASPASPASPAGSAPVVASSPAASPAIPGGAFVTATSSTPQATGGAPAQSSASPDASSSPASPSPDASPDASPAQSAAPESSAQPSTPSTAPGSGSSSGGSGALSGACTSEGSWNCLDGSTYQRCASGIWSAAQPVAAGTKCTVGQSDSLAVTAGKRAVRFGTLHSLRRAGQ